MNLDYSEVFILFLYCLYIVNIYTELRFKMSRYQQVSVPTINNKCHVFLFAYQQLVFLL